MNLDHANSPESRAILLPSAARHPTRPTNMRVRCAQRQEADMFDTADLPRGSRGGTAVRRSGLVLAGYRAVRHSGAELGRLREDRTCRRRHTVRPSDEQDHGGRYPPYQSPVAGPRTEHQDSGSQRARRGPVEGRTDHGPRGLGALPPRAGDGRGYLPENRSGLCGGSPHTEFPLRDPRRDRRQYRQLALLGRA